MLRLAGASSVSRHRVSVVIPCYNYACYLEACVDSALGQRGVDVEIIIIDDASTDGSDRIAEKICYSNPQVRLVRHERNLGHLRTANEALRSAGSDFIVKLDADDLLTAGSLVRSADLLSTDHRIGFVYGYARDFVGQVPQVPDSNALYWKVWSGRAWLKKVLRRAHNVIAQPEVMIRRQALVDVGGQYDERLPWAEDYNLWLRLAARWRVGYVGGCVQGLYRVHSRSIQRSANDLHLSDLRARVDATRIFLSETPENTQVYGRLAFQALARDTRILLAARRELREKSNFAIDEYERISHDLEVASATSRARGPLTWPGPLGRNLRTFREKLRWRRWRLIGV